MTKQEKIEMFSMRLDGATLQSIGDKYGITRERVRQILEVPSNVRKSDKYLYQNLVGYIHKHKMSMGEFSEKCDIKYNTFLNYMNGKSEISISSIRKVLEITGMSFEEAFNENQKEESREAYDY